MLARITSTRVNDDDRLRLPPIPPPQSSGTEKKESQDRHHNQACRPSGKRSSTSSHDLHHDDVLTVTSSLQISRRLTCLSSVSRWCNSERCRSCQEAAYPRLRSAVDVPRHVAPRREGRAYDAAMVNY